MSKVSRERLGGLVVYARSFSDGRRFGLRVEGREVRIDWKAPRDMAFGKEVCGSC